MPVETLQACAPPDVGPELLVIVGRIADRIGTMADTVLRGGVNARLAAQVCTWLAANRVDTETVKSVLIARMGASPAAGEMCSCGRPAKLAYTAASGHRTLFCGGQS